LIDSLIACLWVRTGLYIHCRAPKQKAGPNSGSILDPDHFDSLDYGCLTTLSVFALGWDTFGGSSVNQL